MSIATAALLLAGCDAAPDEQSEESADRATVAAAPPTPPPMPSATADRVELFAPDVVSTAAIDSAIAWLPDGGLLVARRDGRWGAAPSQPARLLHYRSLGDGGSEPEVLFPELTDASDPALSPDGRTLVFVSSHPRTEGDRDRDLWVSERTEHGWAPPQRLGDAINSEVEEMGPSIDGEGGLWYSSMKRGGLGQGDIWFAAAGDGTGRFEAAQPIGHPINSEHGEWNVLIAPDGTWMIFESSSRPTNLSIPGDLYFARRGADGSWRAPVPLAAINTMGSDLNATLDRDGRTLYFVSTGRNGPGEADVYRVPLDVVLASATAPPTPTDP